MVTLSLMCLVKVCLLLQIRCIYKSSISEMQFTKKVLRLLHTHCAHLFLHTEYCNWYREAAGIMSYLIIRLERVVLFQVLQHMLHGFQPYILYSVSR